MGHAVLEQSQDLSAFLVPGPGKALTLCAIVDSLGVSPASYHGPHLQMRALPPRRDEEAGPKS